jgi:copper chaperone NosL
MKRSASILLLFSCLLLAVIYTVPLWYIDLEAPQYPGGLRMYIWIHQITGTDEFTLQNINILNHYIGMEAIHPDSFAELTIMPLVLAGLIAAGMVAALLRRKGLALGWTVLLALAGTAGLVDFYLWIQKFGTNLDPSAPIKIEGMTYSPPFIGVKTLLNITAVSFPHLGGLAFGGALLSASVAVYLSFKAEPVSKSAVQLIVDH